MNDANKCAIIIPMYTTQLCNQEKIALKQAKKIFKMHDIIVVVPDSLSVNENDFSKMERFKDSFFKSIADYNRLMLSADFYKRFQDYEYILIYQLDAFVFSNQLSYFCQLGYDYIGAPWLYGIFNYIDAEHSVFYVGNGGLSLRRVRSFIKVLEERQPLLDEQIKNEDLFFSSVVCEEFRIAPLEVALQFSFERQVEKCYEMNNHKLPFGCHAWERYNFSFWKPYIEREGYMLPERIESLGNEDITRSAEYACFTGLSAFFENNFDKEALRQKLEKKLDMFQKSFVIFGAGFSGKALMKCLVDIGVPVRGFCDNNDTLIGKTLTDFPIFHISEIKSCREENFIIIANLEHEISMAEQLTENDFVRNRDYITFSDFVDLLYEDISG